jgi:hypothetical protein
MNKFWQGIQGYWSCVSWFPGALLKFLLEEYPDLKFWKRHTNLDDHLWYAERVNGRIAMLTLTLLFLWNIAHGMQFNSFLL